jgi:beta-glucosidase
MAWGGSLNITCLVSNVGHITADEVVQLYIHDRVASRVRPIRELKGFSRITLTAGATKNVTFTLDRHALSFAIADPHQASVSGNKSVAEPGMFSVWVTSSATAGQAAEFELLGE